MSKRSPLFSEKEKLAILEEGEKNGVKAVRAKYDISDHTYRNAASVAQLFDGRQRFLRLGIAAI